MGYGWRDVPGLLRFPEGRWEVLRGGAWRLWPVLRPAARAWRRAALARTRVVAVTGSLGKTTTARCVAAALGARMGPLPSNQFGLLALNLLAVHPWQGRAVLEVGIDGPGQMEVYADMLRPDLTVVTAVASEHRRSLGALDATQREKGQMVRALGPGGVAVLNGDDPRVCPMAAGSRARTVTYGFEPHCDVRARTADLRWPRGTALTVEVGGRTLELQSRLFGRVMVYPVLAALAAAWAAGTDPGLAACRLEAVEPSPGRFQPVFLPSGAIVVRDDFKAPLESIEAALDFLAEVPARRRFALLGDVTEPPGSQGPIYRALGRRAAASCDRILVLGDRVEHTLPGGASEAGFPRERIARCRGSYRTAVELLRDELGPGDVVLVKGRQDQRLERVTLALEGRAVGCPRRTCGTKVFPCSRCSRLARLRLP
ncbi:MAG: hypothetical protein HY900_34775 [Deltaproteobacteria bacterium]|nr:hypothetical protein [Deltaproteobacteria bacterium]